MPTIGNFLGIDTAQAAAGTTGVQSPASSQASTQTQSTGSQSGGTDESDLQTFDDAAAAAEAARQARQEAYDKATSELLSAIKGADPNTASQSDVEDMKAKYAALGSLDVDGVDTSKGEDASAQSQSQEIKVEDYVKDKETQYGQIVTQIQSLGQGSLTNDMASFAEVVQNYNSMIDQLNSEADSSNMNLVKELTGLEEFDDSAQNLVKQELGKAMQSSLQNSVNALYESEDYKILTGEISATDEEKKAARANFEAQKSAISSAGGAFEELGLALPEGCTITTVVNWGSQAKEGDKYANDCMDRIIANYLSDNNLEGKLSPSQAYEMIMQLNPDIYETIDSGEYIHAGQQFLMPDPSAIRGMDSVEQQLEDEAMQKIQENGGLEGVSADAVYDYNSKDNTVTIKDGETIKIYDAETGEIRKDADDNPIEYTEDSVREDMQAALKASFTDIAGDINLGDIELNESDSAGNLSANYEYEYEDENGKTQTATVRVTYNPATGKSIIDTADAEGNFDQRNSITHDKDSSTVSYKDGDNKVVETVDSNGNVQYRDIYDSQGILISSGKDGSEATFGYSSEDGSLSEVKIGDETKTVEEILGDDSNGIESRYQAQEILKQMARGVDFDKAVENVKEGNYGTQKGQITEEQSKEALAAAGKLRSDFPADGVEFTMQPDGSYSGEYKIQNYSSGNEYESTYKVTYDPETGKTTITAYDTSGDKTAVDENISSVFEYDKEANTKTSTIYTSGYSSSEGKFSGKTVTVQQYGDSDELMDDDALIQTTSNEYRTYEGEEEEKLASQTVTTYHNGEIDGKYGANYSKDDTVQSISITDEYGVRKTINASDLENIEGVSKDSVSKALESIQKGASAKQVISNLGEGVLEALNGSGEDDESLALSNREHETGAGQLTNEIESFVNSGLMQELEGFETNGEVNSEDGSVTYTKKGEDDKEITYKATQNDDGTITLTQKDGDSATTITFDKENSTKNIETVQKDGSKTVEFTKFTEDEKEQGKFINDVIVTEYDSEGKLKAVSINAKDLDPETLTETEINNIKKDLASLDGNKSPSTIINNALQTLGIDTSISASQSLQNATQEAEELTFSYEDYMNAVQDSKGLDYLKENVNSDNIGAIISELSENDEWWSLSSLMISGDEKQNEYIGKVCARALSDGNIDTLKENGQYETMIKSITNDLTFGYGTYAFEEILAADKPASSQAIGDILLQYASGDYAYCEDLDDMSWYVSGFVNSLYNEKAVSAFENALIDLASSDKTIEGVEKAQGEDGTKATYGIFAQKTLASAITTYYSSESSEKLVEKISDKDNLIMSGVAIEYRNVTDGGSIFDALDDENAIKKLADTLVKSYDEAGWQSSIADELAWDLYQAMVGSGCRHEVVSAILKNDNIRNEILTNIDAAFAQQAADGEHGKYKSTTLYTYMYDQKGDTRTIAEDIKDLLKDSVD